MASNYSLLTIDKGFAALSSHKGGMPQNIIAKMLGKPAKHFYGNRVFSIDEEVLVKLPTTLVCRVGCADILDNLHFQLGVQN